MPLFTLEELQLDNPDGDIEQNHYDKGEPFARAIVENACGRRFSSATYTSEVVDNIPSLGGLLEFANRGVTSITSVLTDFHDTALASETIDSKYIAKRSWGCKLLAVYDPDFYLVTYVAGPATTPAPIKEAALEIAKHRVRPKDRPVGLVSMSVDGVSYQFDKADWAEGRYTGIDWVDAILNDPTYNNRKTTTLVG